MAEMIKEALNEYKVLRESELVKEALAFQLDYTIRTDRDKVRLAAFSCRVLLLFCNKAADRKFNCNKAFNRKFIIKELEALMRLVEKLSAERKSLSLRERDFLEALDWGLSDYYYWLLCLPKQVNSVIEALNQRVVVIDMRP